jgi:hypothetical protein
MTGIDRETLHDRLCKNSREFVTAAVQQVLRDEVEGGIAEAI